MYNIYVDGVLIHHAQSPDPDLKVTSPKLKMSDNAAGSLTFTMAPSNPGYDILKRLVSEIVVKRDGIEIWSGRVIDEKTDFFNNRSVTCEGELAYLNDTTQPQAEYHDITPAKFLETLIYNHNVKVSKGPKHKGIVIKFNASCFTENNYDYLDIYYKESNGSYSRIRKMGNFGGSVVTIPAANEFYLHWHTDNSVQNWGWAIDSVDFYDGDTFDAVTAASLPTGVTFEEKTSFDVLESSHNYESNLNKYYKVAVLDKKRSFKIGIVSVTDPNDSIYRYTNYESTYECITSKLIKQLNGHLRIRKVDGIRYLDYLADYPNTNSQVIEFGTNLVDFTRNWDVSELATVVLPFGCNISELGGESSIDALEEYLTVESVNNGSIYVTSEDAMAEYGWIETVVHWDDVGLPENLLRKAKEYLQEIQFEEMTIELSAVDMHFFDVNTEAIDILDEIRCISYPHGMNKLFPITSVEIPLDKPDDTKYTLGSKTKKNQGISASIRSANESIKEAIEQVPSQTTILNKAKENADALINQYNTGYIQTLVTEDELGTHSEALRIINNEDYTKATKYWLWNINGLAHYDTTKSSSPNLALTADGGVVADRVIVGILGDLAGVNYWNMENGDFRLSSAAQITRSVNYTYSYIPTASNYPAFNWTTDSAKKSHLGETFLCTANNTRYVWKKTSSGYGWYSSPNTLAGYINEQITDGVGDFDELLTQTEIFNRLTNNGTAQGVYMNNGNLYINASYIQSGSISADRISGGTITGITISGNTISGNEISGGTISGTTITGGIVSGTTIFGSTISGTTISGGTLYSGDVNGVRTEIVGGVITTYGNVSGSKTTTNYYYSEYSSGRIRFTRENINTRKGYTNDYYLSMSYSGIEYSFLDSSNIETTRSAIKFGGTSSKLTGWVELIGYKNIYKTEYIDPGYVAYETSDVYVGPNIVSLEVHPVDSNGDSNGVNNLVQVNESEVYLRYEKTTTKNNVYKVKSTSLYINDGGLLIDKSFNDDNTGDDNANRGLEAGYSGWFSYDKKTGTQYGFIKDSENKYHDLRFKCGLLIENNVWPT